LPFWDVFVSQFLKISNQLFYVVGPIRYEIMILIILIGILYIIKYLKVYKSKNLIFIFLYLTFMVFSTFLTSHNFLLTIEGIKLQFLLILYIFFLSILINKNISKLPTIEIINKIFLFQLISVILIALLELYNQNILVFLYNKPLEDIPHISFFSFQRLISIIGNPINLGAFILVTLAFQINLYTNKNNFFAKYTLFILAGLVVLLTLSRLALIVFIVFVLILVIIKGRKGVILLLIIIIISSIIYLLFLDIELGKFGSRIFGILDSNVVLNNSRLDNWTIAFSQIDGIINFMFGFGLGQSNPSSELVENHGAFMIENAFVSVFIDLGLSGLVIYIAIFLRFVYLSISYYNLTKNPSFIIFIFIMFIFSLANDFHRNMPFSFYFWFFLVWLEISNLNLRKVKYEK